MPRQTTLASSAMVNIFWSVEPSIRALFNSVPNNSQYAIEQLHGLYVDLIAIPFPVLKTLSAYIRSRLLPVYYQYKSLKTFAIRPEQALTSGLHSQTIYSAWVNDPLFLRSETHQFHSSTAPFQVQKVRNTGLSVYKTLFPKWEFLLSNSNALATKKATIDHKSPYRQSLIPRIYWHNFDTNMNRSIPSGRFLQVLSTSVSEKRSVA